LGDAIGSVCGCVAGAVVGEGVECGGPALLECVDESGFDFGCDVAVDVFDFVGDAMSEPAGLGHIRDAVGDKPGLVTVPEPVKHQAGSDGVNPGAGSGAVVVAVGGGSHGAAGEVRPAE
jgi:hypothetical protein